MCVAERGEGRVLEERDGGGRRIEWRSDSRIG